MSYIISLTLLTAIFQVNLGYLVLLKLRVTEVVVATGAIRRAKLQTNHHHQQTNAQCFTGRMPFLSPNQKCQSTERSHASFDPVIKYLYVQHVQTKSKTTVIKFKLYYKI